VRSAAAWSRAAEAATPGAALPSPIHTGARARWIRLRLWTRMARLALRCYPGPAAGGRAMRALVRQLQAVRPDLPVAKYVRAAGRWFYAFDAPGYPSAAFDRFVMAQLNRAVPFRAGHDLDTLVLAVTRRCPLRCRHCSEWQNLHGPEALTVEELVAVARRFRERGLSHLQMSGGEPLQRLEAVEAIARDVSPEVECWVLTSGVGLVPEVARRLRAAGVVGVQVSLDDVEAAGHDAFRGVEGTFARAVAGARTARANDLALCLNFTARRELLTPERLERYPRLARDLGAGFVQVLEPRPVGRWAGAEVSLSAAEAEVLQRFQATMTRAPDMPSVWYQAGTQRRIGCWGAGRRFAFVDALGRLQACPFCQEPAGSCLDADLDAALRRLRARGCHVEAA
jgi:MoaA/NifB/PqqE/SkfB family radical SAM enzyme